MRRTILLRAIEEGTLGRGFVAGDEYLHNMPLEAEMATWGQPFLAVLRQVAGVAGAGG